MVMSRIRLAKSLGAAGLELEAARKTSSCVVTTTVGLACGLLSSRAYTRAWLPMTESSRSFSWLSLPGTAV
jgi:hypothetical protein